ncbi:cell division ATP-binding protein FtsE [Candidatus Roizmanbacteria bacterium RIFCSPLOWO2_02_FULL_37_19]|uniref:Cell division ATP-binding protein FtsE n=1 Tax=Candidatus Roizmanbacteria bacterium RIFCSPHIGHO2_02_FULL_37_24 TaxID=1802037 RepID=A0A1F7GZZ6_9BACT|nr:MAG: cell division ATP-binding protein FtsE [Candidatus Roizmanbacteria bacterium RIFCSPHIGHO2_01_FULL_38_41]OGK24042.1 MAG: cell division ATP-binding protein FtsE [Candidatus Roizmanbacteria bacterium RIFCSPHIGHO2_02_FULL_37_24]OGK33504.1 MAG: cell division ATP-binding protein FtsE [Candidatus Roizmanbacteria bacterium RIFCSPHIGHO2_12_FULL_37_23]OGK44864.1 MAG: cell division ATP-binding protein FtsE [Candidatus Roizmanbacteria bacterium RIFCSPLOWO2_01_FULL_37_57]OGK55181.1 MAG: cell divisio
MIVFDKVSKKYGTGTIALDDVSFEIQNNEFLFLVGPSGAGKTTILKMILRQILPTSGTIMVNDKDISNKNFKDVEKYRQTIGIVFQDFKILMDKNVFENIAIALKITKTSQNKIKQEVDEVLSLVGLETKRNVFPLQLSAGELQRVAIARAIVGERNIILADEPTGNLDPKTTWDIMKIFKKIEDEKTIIIATHNVDIVNSFKKRVITLKDGQLTKDRRLGKYEL